jgi:two-component system, response regulator, stage 0 sporulation protein F
MAILVVEDEKLLNWSLAESLAKWGFEVKPVSTGNEAVSLLAKSTFEVVLLDYQLPDLDGLEVARHVRRIQPGAIIILVTAYQLSELPMEAGLIDFYLNKPLDLQQLHQQLVNICSHRRSGKKQSGAFSAHPLAH